MCPHLGEGKTQLGVRSIETWDKFVSMLKDRGFGIHESKTVIYTWKEIEEEVGD